MTKKKNENRIAGIYKITNTINNKVYIGESLNIEERWIVHKSDLDNGNHHSYKLQQEWDKYGSDNFIFEIIEEIDKNYNPSLQQLILIAYEDKYIRKYNSLDTGYNCEDTLHKILNKEKGVYNDNIINDKSIKKLNDIIGYMNRHNGKFKIRENKKNNEVKKEKNYKNDIVTKIDYPCSFRECISYLVSTSYKLNSPMNRMMSKFRELNIFYYNEYERNIPKNEYLNKYFIIEQITPDIKDFIPTIKILVTQEGIKFITDILLHNNLILP